MAINDIPLKVEASEGGSPGCEEKEPYVLMVLGDSMLPEFSEGDVIVIEPGSPPSDGSYVVAEHNGEVIFRQLQVRPDGLYIMPLNPAYPSHKLDGMHCIRGLITQRKGRGRANRSYYT